MLARPHTVAVAGGILGDEGKGRVTDELTARFLKNHSKVVHYRDNGGANAGHTVLVKDKKIVLHQLSSGVLQPGCVCILGKNMVLHPEDLVSEIESVKQATNRRSFPAQLLIEELASTALDTHRAMEGVLKSFHSGKSTGSTGRGISPAYADLIYRHPILMRDLISSEARSNLARHYQLYERLVSGFGVKLAEIEVVRIDNTRVLVGSEKAFISRVLKAIETLRPFIKNTQPFLRQHWEKTTPFVFEKAQAFGLDIRWGVYPDVTASNCGFDGIHSSTEGLVTPESIPYRVATIKATYTSSVGSRILPTQMPEELEKRIQVDANEYGSTTGRPRDIVYLDLPMIRFFLQAGKATHLALTHLDISYLDTPIRVCVGYTKNGKAVSYRPDQTYLLGVKPVYREFKPWDGAQVRGVTSIDKLPSPAKTFLNSLERLLETPIAMITTGPERSETIFLLPKL